MVFSDEDKILLKRLYPLKSYKATGLMSEFLNKWWANSSIRHTADSQSGPCSVTQDRHSVKMLWNYHHEYFRCGG